MAKRNGWIILCLLLMLYITPLKSVSAQSGQMTLEIFPGEVQLSPGETADILIIARNGSSKSANDLHLKILPTAGVEVEWLNSNQEVEQIASQAAVYWIVQITRKNTTFSSEEVNFFLTYESYAAEGSPPVSDVVIEKLQFPNRPDLRFDDVISTRIEADFNNLQEYQKGNIYIFAENLKEFPIDLEIGISGEEALPAYLSLNRLDQVKVLNPREVAKIIYEVDFIDGKQIVPGDILSSFLISAEWEEDADYHLEKAISNRFHVGPFFEQSGVLNVLGVPTFFLLPGFLAVSIFVLFWEKADPKKDFYFDMKSSHFWVIAVLLSLIAAPIYRMITKRNYLIGYTLTDVLWIWVRSLAFGFLFWGGWRSVSKILEWNKQRNIPTEQDTPLVLLKKLYRRKMGVRLSEMEFEGLEDRYFEFSVDKKEPEYVWGFSRISYIFTDLADSKFQKNFRKNLDKGNTKQIIQLVKDGLLNQKLKLEWEKNKKPVRVLQSKIKGTAFQNKLIFWEK